MVGNNGIDKSVAHPARVWDYLLGGRDNFAADREAAEVLIRATPAAVQVARADRLFLASVVHHLAAGAGIRQFLDIGTGLPTASNTHEVAQRVAPDSRVVYVDNDPVVLLHARTLLDGDPRGATAYVDADLRDPDTILSQAAATLDFTEPVAVMLLGILLYLDDSEGPYGIVRQLMDTVPPGSYLAVSHGASDVDPGVAAGAREFNERAATPMTLRTKAEFARFFDGLELQRPGVVTLDAWHLGGEQPSRGGTLPAYCGLGCKN
jgi:O-methyltransferase involved in polyketide biosynthesis